MILAISTSSAQASVAVLETSGKLVFQEAVHAPRAASQAVLDLAKPYLRAGELTAVVADVGPGSFTGVKVGVVLAKTWGYTLGLRVGGISAFDLISRDGIRVVPSRRDQFFVHDGTALVIAEEAPPGVAQNPPLAANVVQVMDRIAWSDWQTLVPAYVLPPSISTPKRKPLHLTP